MNINPNLKNPLSLFAICFLIVESIFTTLFMWRVESIILCPCMIKMLLIFIIAFPLIVFVGFYVLLLIKPEVLFSPLENAYAKRILKQNAEEVQERAKEKVVMYGLDYAINEESDISVRNEAKPILAEKTILNQYISQYAPFLRKDVKVQTKDSFRYFDAYANWNGCDYVVEVKRVRTWTSSCVQGVSVFASNARSCFSFAHMTLILQIEDMFNKGEIVRQIHEIEPALNIVFASLDENSNIIKFSKIN